MLFNSVDFLIFFPVVVLIYFLIPHRIRYIWLLIASYYFYMSWNPRYIVLILTSTLLTWAGGLALGAVRSRTAAKEPGPGGRTAAKGTGSEGRPAAEEPGPGGRPAAEEPGPEGRTAAKEPGPGGRKGLQKGILILCLLLNLAILFFFKYYDFAAENLTTVFSWFHITLKMPEFDILLPVGISFYTFQALGYLIDVYREDIQPEKNVLKYALFVSFFPQLVAGPIERSKNLLGQMHEKHTFDGRRAVSGLLLMAWGFFQKLVIADRAAILVTEIYNNYAQHTGTEIVAATVLFAVQIYCDFAGYSDIAVGAAQVMGFRLMKNFKSPYYATTVSRFWRNWHISLTTWLRDYLYIPLGGNRRGKWKKYRNILITFLVSGLWHGASWNYVIWGFLNGFYQVAGDVTKGIRSRVQSALHIRTDCWSYRLFQGLFTFVLVDFSWLFFRANSMHDALGMLARCIQRPGLTSLVDFSTFWGISTMGLDEKNMYLLLGAILILGIVDLFRGRVNLRQKFFEQNLIFRYVVYLMIIFVLLIFGIYGPEYDASTFIYFQF